MQGTCYTISEGLSFVSVRGDAEQEREVTAAGGGVITADIRTIVHATLSPVDLQHLVSDVKVYTASPSRASETRGPVCGNGGACGGCGLGIPGCRPARDQCVPFLSLGAARRAGTNKIKNPSP